MLSLLQISGRGWYEGGGRGGNRILRRNVCWLRAQPGIYHCLVRKQSVFLQLSFKLLQISNFSLPSAGQIWKDLEYSQGQVKPSKQKQLWQTFRERKKRWVGPLFEYFPLPVVWHWTWHNEWVSPNPRCCALHIISVTIIVIVLLSLSSVQLMHHNYIVPHHIKQSPVLPCHKIRREDPRYHVSIRLYSRHSEEWCVEDREEGYLSQTHRQQM